MNAMSRLGPCAHISHQDEEQNESKKKIEASWPFLSFSHWPSRDRFIGVESLLGEMQSGGLFRAMIKKFTRSSCHLHFQPDHTKPHLQTLLQCLFRSLTEIRRMAHLLRQRLLFWWVSAMKNVLKGATLTGGNRLVAPQEELDSGHCPWICQR
jgi:hypothetical protein